MGRHLDDGAGAGGDWFIQQPDLAHDHARQPRRQSGSGADLNAYGRRPLDLGGVHIALREAGAAIVAGSDRKLSFGGAATATIAAGAVAFSDPVALDLPPLADLAVSFYLPGEVLNDFQITGRYARQTNYVSPPGDFAAAQVMPIASLTSDWFFAAASTCWPAPTPVASSRSATR